MSDARTSETEIRRDCPQYTAEEMMRRWFRNLSTAQTLGVDGTRG